MSGLPPDGTWLIQQVDDDVILFHRDTQEEVVRFKPGNTLSFLPAQQVIADAPQLTPEQKAMAHFWSGYFYAYARGGAVG